MHSDKEFKADFENLILKVKAFEIICILKKLKRTMKSNSNQSKINKSLNK